MRQLRALSRQEWRLQARSSRFRFAVLGYLVLGAVPPAMVFFLIRRYGVQAWPMLRLEEVGAAQVEGGGWRAEGKVRNTGSGEVMCPVVIKAELGETKQVVKVDTKSATPFELFTSSRPLTVLLDPNKTCFRFVHKNSVAHERVYFQGAAS